jgi:hypothetical protein
MAASFYHLFLCSWHFSICLAKYPLPFPKDYGMICSSCQALLSQKKRPPLLSRGREGGLEVPEKKFASLEHNTQPRRGAQGLIELRLHIEPLDKSELSWRDRITVLRGQLTLVRMRIELGMPAPIESIRRAERLARSIEQQSRGGQ